MVRWLVLLLIIVGAYSASQNWPAVESQWNNLVKELSASLPTRTVASDKVPGSKNPVAMPGLSLWSGLWRTNNVAGLRVDLPCTVSPYTPPDAKTAPANVRLDFYRGVSGTRKVFIGHGMNMTMAGGMALTAFNRPLENAADGHGLDVISLNSGTTLLNGYRARRSDYASRTTPRDRVRCLLLERGNQAWFIETHALETDSDGEGVFMRIVQSVQ